MTQFNKEMIAITSDHQMLRWVALPLLTMQEFKLSTRATSINTTSVPVTQTCRLILPPLPPKAESQPPITFSLISLSPKSKCGVGESQVTACVPEAGQYEKQLRYIFISLGDSISAPQKTHKLGNTKCCTVETNDTYSFQLSVAYTFFPYINYF